MRLGTYIRGHEKRRKGAGEWSGDGVPFSRFYIRRAPNEERGRERAGEEGMEQEQKKNNSCKGFGKDGVEEGSRERGGWRSIYQGERG